MNQIPAASLLHQPIADDYLVKADNCLETVQSQYKKNLPANAERSITEFLNFGTHRAQFIANNTQNTWYTHILQNTNAYLQKTKITESSRSSAALFAEVMEKLGIPVTSNCMNES